MQLKVRWTRKDSSDTLTKPNILLKVFSKAIIYNECLHKFT